VERARMGLSMARTPQTVKAQGIPQAVPSPISLLPLPPLPRRISPQAFQPGIPAHTQRQRVIGASNLSVQDQGFA
jgi:hypothetical protein